ncbi:MAG: phosphoribosylglycinamide synthetase C domain-containing protein [Candidatus Saccharimonadales bacterium]
MADVERLLVVGSGGREFAIIDEAIHSGVERVYSTRGEDAVSLGIEGVINTGIGEKNVSSIGTFAAQENIDLVIVGPEAPLITGVSNILRHKGIAVYGPDKDGAKFEEDKCNTHQFVEKYGLSNPPNSQTFLPGQKASAKALVKELGPEGVYTKRVGQEGGKGAVGYGEGDLELAYQEVDAVADKGESLLVQGRLRGPEYSAMFMLDGRGNAVATALSRDHKALFDGGLGPNTGGMGAFAPLTTEQASQQRREEIEQIGLKIAGGLVEEGIDFRGTLYAGLMAVTPESDSPLSILEFNVRFGDPETQVLLKSLGGRAIDYMFAMARGDGEMDMSRLYLSADNSPVALTICLASPGYSQDGQAVVIGLPVNVPRDLPEDMSIQFAGARQTDDGIVSSGGRVLYATKTGSNIAEARKVYDYIGRDNGGICLGDDEQVIRSDIGLV